MEIELGECWSMCPDTVMMGGTVRGRRVVRVVDAETGTLGEHNGISWTDTAGNRGKVRGSVWFVAVGQNQGTEL